MNTSVATAFENPASWNPRFGLPASLVAAIMGLATCGIQAQTTQASPLQIRQTDGKIFLDYYPGFASTGATMLHFSPDPGNLQSTNASIFDIPAASSGPITWDVTTYCTGPLGFFDITEFPGLASSDFRSDEDGSNFIAAPPTFNVETFEDVPYPLVVETPMHVQFRLLDGTTDLPTSLNGSVRLEVINPSGAAPGFPYTLTPDTLPMTSGEVDGSVTLATAGVLDGFYLAVAGITVNASAGRAPRGGPPTVDRKIFVTRKVLADYKNTAINWHYPLPTTPKMPQITGNFGEWRSKTSAGRPHLGMDLAAPIGTPVYPVKRGVVSSALPAWEKSMYYGHYVTVVHGDGTASVYRHLFPTVAQDQVVEISTVIGTVEKTDLPTHLHFELRSDVVPTSARGSYLALGQNPGKTFDPGVENAIFDTPIIQNEVTDNSPPQIKALYVWDKDPKTTEFSAVPGTHAIQGSPGQFLVAQLVDIEHGRLVPSHFDFSYDNPLSITHELIVRDSFDYVSEGDGSSSDVLRLFQNSPMAFPDFGYVRRTGGILPDTAMYQYWFKWDTSIYTGHRFGPRQVRISAKDHMDKSVEGTFTFGPEITAPGPWQADPAATDGTTFILAVTSYMGPFPQVKETDSVKPVDEITLTFELPDGIPSWNAEFVDADGNPLPKPVKLSPSSAAYTDGKANLTARVRIRKKADSTPGTTETLTLRAVSKVFPGIAHDMQVQVSPFNEFALIPAGEFVMGDQSSPLVGYSDELPVHTVQGSAFYLGKYEVTKEEWDAVRAWGLANGYTDMASGNGSYASKGANHPVHSINWYDIVKWCNARSQKEGLTPCYTVSGATYKTGESDPVCNWSVNGYRLPTEAEWEKAARGGLSRRNFPWGDTISHSQANYYSSTSYAYDVSPTRGYHPTYAVGSTPDSSPSGSFASNGYGLYDMAGNMWEWCWDWYGSYAVGSETDPRGASSGSGRVYRGGGWDADAGNCRVTARGGDYGTPTRTDFRIGFRLARSSISQLQSRLVAYYPFDGNADDASGNNLNLASDGVTPTADRFGRSDAAYKFDGFNDWLHSDNVPEPSDNAFSWALWIKPAVIPSGAEWGNWILNRNNANSSDMMVSPHLTLKPGGTIMFTSYDNRLDGNQNWMNALSSKTNLEVDQWYHIVCTSGLDNTRRIYINGVLDSSLVSSGYGQTGLGTINIGADRNPLSHGAGWPGWFQGAIDDVRIYGRELSAAEVISLYGMQK